MPAPLAALGGCLLLVTVQAQNPAGLKVGARAPAFALKDQAGKERSLDEFLKNGKLALVFFRSASG